MPGRRLAGEEVQCAEYTSVFIISINSYSNNHVLAFRKKHETPLNFALKGSGGFKG